LSRRVIAGGRIKQHDRINTKLQLSQMAKSSLQVLGLFVLSLLVGLGVLELLVRGYALVTGQYAILAAYPNRPPISAAYDLRLVDQTGRVMDGFNVQGGLLIRLDPATGYYLYGPHQNAFYQTNRVGFRDRREFPLAKPKGVKRIMVTGGSAAFGFLATANEQVFTQRLETALQTLGGERVEVINAAAPGFTSRQELSLLVNRLLDYEPDLVLSLSGFNDFSRSSQLRDADLALDGVERLTAGVFTHLGSWGQEQGDALFASLFVIKGLRYWYLKPGELAPAQGPYRPQSLLPLDASEMRRRAARYETSLQRMADLLAAQDVPLVVAVQPTLYNRAYPRLGPNEVAFARWYEGRDPAFPGLVQAGYPLFAQAAQRVAGEHPQMVWVDLTRMFDGVADEVFLDYVHFNDQGHEILTQQLLPILRPLL